MSKIKKHSEIRRKHMSTSLISENPTRIPVFLLVHVNASEALPRFPVFRCCQVYAIYNNHIIPSSISLVQSLFVLRLPISTFQYNITMGRIPSALQAIFLASNGGNEVDVPPKNLGFKVFSGIVRRKNKKQVYNKPNKFAKVTAPTKHAVCLRVLYPVHPYFN
jgi:hypothetical protein